MRSVVFVLSLAVGALTLGPDAAPAQEASAEPAPSAAFLFSYRPHAGERALFEQGYREHLAWHRQHDDPLDWLGWDVIAGPGLGAFVDGIFGVPFRALDERVEPAEDARDAELHVRAHADALGRDLMVLRQGLSTATPLEEGGPPPLVQVVRVTVRPGRGAAVERALDDLRSEARERPLLPYTVYERVAGGGAPAFLLMIWRERFASFDRTDRNPEPRLRALLAVDGPGQGAVTSMINEIWQYRRDLTYLADRAEGS